MRFQMLAALTAAALVAGAMGSAAAEAEAAKPLNVSFKGIDLATAKGHADAIKRIKQAAAVRCGSPEALEGFDGYDACVKAQVATATAALPPVAVATTGAQTGG